jgi:hypothetical protein
MSTKASNGMRIRFEKQDHLLVSVKLFSNGEKIVRLILDTHEMEYRIVDAVTGFIYEDGGNVTNMEVLQRKGKRHLKKFLGIHFDKEVRNVKQPDPPRR